MFFWFKFFNSCLNHYHLPNQPFLKSYFGNINVPLKSEDAGCGLRPEPRNVNGHPWSCSLRKDLQKVQNLMLEIEYLKFLCKYLFKFLNQPYSLRLYNCLIALSQKIWEAWQTGRREKRCVLVCKRKGGMFGVLHWKSWLEMFSEMEHWLLKLKTFEFEYENDLWCNNIILKMMSLYHIFLRPEH